MPIMPWARILASPSMTSLASVATTAWPELFGSGLVRCNGRTIADYLLLIGHDVDHLLAPGHSDRATPTPAAQLAVGWKVIYPGT